MDYDIVIIGSGVAGLSAGLYAIRGNKKILILEENNIGGITATLDLIENYPGFQKVSGFELISNMYNQVSSLGCEFLITNIINIDFDNKTIKISQGSINYKALIIASGSSYKKLDLPSEEEFKQKGISYCAVCDGNLYKNKHIVVITDGFSAKNSIDYLYNISQNITVLDIANSYKNDKINVYNNVKINEFYGDVKIQGVSINIDNKNLKLDCDGIFISLGTTTNTKLYQDKINTDRGYIISDENMHTNIEGVFVAGDIRKKNLRQIVTACSDGAIAGSEAIKYLNKK
jgi:thioredoxin reductase (NADPH)